MTRNVIIKLSSSFGRILKTICFYHNDGNENRRKGKNNLSNYTAMTKFLTNSSSVASMVGFKEIKGISFNYACWGEIPDFFASSKY